MSDPKSSPDDECTGGEASGMRESSILLITESSTVPIESPVVRPEASQEENPEIPTTSNGSDSSICRICQLGFEESGEILRDTACKCKGSVKRVHATCLIMWVRQKGSNACEICGGTFFVSPPSSQSDVIPIVSIQNWPSDASQGSLSRRLGRCLENRFVFVVLVFLLLIITGSAGTFTVKTFKVLQNDHDNVTGDPHLQFLLCLCFLLLSGTATLIFIGSWIYLETAAHCRLMRRRRILQQLGLTV